METPGKKIFEKSPVIQGVPKKIIFKVIFEFLSLGEVFLGVKNNSKNFGNKKKYKVA